MRKKAILFALSLILTTGYIAVGDEAIEELLRAVVKVRAEIPADAYTARALGTERSGNGVVIDEKGHVLTIGYLILEAGRIEVTGPDGKTVSAKYVGYDYDTGFGILLPNSPLEVAPLKFGRSSELKVGDRLFVAGFGGLESVQTVEVLSRREFAGYWEYLLDSAIYTSPPYRNYGGAALIGQNGMLLGIGSLFTTLTVPGYGTIPGNVFVPIDLLGPILSDLITKGRSQHPPRPWLGLNAQDFMKRVFVTRITPGGPAEKAGLQTGDIILSVNGEMVEGLSSFYRKVWSLGEAGVDVKLAVLQGVEIRTITVTSADRYRFLNLTPGRRMVQAR
jgi:S1-C subfamily serine protease